MPALDAARFLPYSTSSTSSEPPGLRLAMCGDLAMLVELGTDSDSFVRLTVVRSNTDITVRFDP